MLLRALNPSRDISKPILAENHVIIERDGEDDYTVDRKLTTTFNNSPIWMGRKIESIDYACHHSLWTYWDIIYAHKRGHLGSAKVRYEIYREIYDCLHGLPCFVYDTFLRDLIIRNDGFKRFTTRKAIDSRRDSNSRRAYDNPLIHRASYFSRTQTVGCEFNVFYEGEAAEFISQFERMFPRMFSAGQDCADNVHNPKRVLDLYFITTYLIYDHVYIQDSHRCSCLIFISLTTRKKKEKQNLSDENDEYEFSDVFPYPWSYCELMCNGYHETNQVNKYIDSSGVVNKSLQPPEIRAHRLDVLRLNSFLFELHLHKITVIPQHINDFSYRNYLSGSTLTTEELNNEQHILRQHVMLRILDQQYDEGWFVVNSPFSVSTYLTREAISCELPIGGLSLSQYYGYMFRNRFRTSEAINGENCCVICLCDFEQFDKVVTFNSSVFCYDCMRKHINNPAMHNYDDLDIENNYLPWKLKCARGEWVLFVPFNKLDSETILKGVRFLNNNKNYYDKYLSDHWAHLSVFKNSPRFNDGWSLQWRHFAKQLLIFKRLRLLLESSIDSVDTGTHSVDTGNALYPDSFTPFIFYVCFLCQFLYFLLVSSQECVS